MPKRSVPFGVCLTGILTNPKFFSSLEINTREGENEFSDSIKKVSHKVTLSLVDHLFSLAGYRYLSLITLKTRSGRKLAGLLAASPAIKRLRPDTEG